MRLAAPKPRASPMKIYTRSGDQGSTSLLGGARVAKCDLRIGATGTLDELNAMLGFVRSAGLSSDFDKILGLLQNRMFDLGAELANPRAGEQGTSLLWEKNVAELESLIDSQEEALPELKSFILPGGSQAGSVLHLARCICRRAEREIVALSQESAVDGAILKYVNRASDLLFVLARAVNASEGADEVLWEKGLGTG